MLALVDLDHTPQEAELVSRRLGGVVERGGVLREARTAVPGSRVQELEADAGVVPHAQRDLAHVRVHRFAQVGDGVDEGDLGGEERVRRVLDHLGRRRVRHEDRRLHVAVQLGDAHRDRGVVTADDHAAGLEEVAHRVALAEELGVRRHADVVGRAGLAQLARHEEGRAHRHGRLVHDDGAGLQHGRDLPGDGLHRREVGGAGLGLGGLHAEEHELGVAGRLGGTDDELQAPGSEALADQRREPLLQDRHLALRQRADPVGVEIGAGDVVAEVGEAGRRGQPHVPRADDRDIAHACAPNVLRSFTRPNPARRR